MPGDKLHYVVIHPRDNVATALTRIPKGTEFGMEGGKQTVRIKQDIEFGHKFAVDVINKGADILKYGEIIGVASVDIEPGEHVHVHNLEGRRGRGDVHDRAN